jgi:hypothetical protein
MWRTVGNNTQTRFDSKNYSRGVGDLDWFQPFSAFGFFSSRHRRRPKYEIDSRDAGQRRQAPGPISSKPAV